MLFDDNVVTNGKAKAGALSGWFGCKERIEYLFLYVWRNADAFVRDLFFDTVTQVFGCGGKSGLVIAAIGLCFALGRRVKAIGNQIQQTPCDVLREHVTLTRHGIKRPLQVDIEAL